MSAETMEPPEWLLPTVERFFLDALEAEFREDEKAGSAAVIEAISRFGDTVDENGGGDGPWFMLATVLAEMAGKHYPPESLSTGDGPAMVEVVSTITGRPVDDPDAEMEDAQSAGSLAAMRMLVAMHNDDRDVAQDVFTALPVDAGLAAIYFLAQMCGGALIGHAERSGTLTDEARERLAARDATRKPAPPGPKSTQHGGMEYFEVPLSEEDKGPMAVKAFAPHGQASYAATLYAPGVDGSRDQAIRFAHAQIVQRESLESTREPLCGTDHAEYTATGDKPITDARAERDRLRAALEQIAPPKLGQSLYRALDQHILTARAALAGQEDDRHV